MLIRYPPPPRTVRFSEKKWQVIVQTSRPKFWKEDFSRICANKNYKLLHAYVQCVYIVSAKYQIAPSKAVVGVERPIKALSMHIHVQKSYKVIIVYVLIAVILSKKKFNQTPSCICSMCLYWIGKVSNCYIKTCGRIWSAHEGTIYAYTKALLGENCLSSHSCHIIKNFIFSEPNSFMRMFNVSTLYRQSIKLFHHKLY